MSEQRDHSQAAITPADFGLPVDDATIALDSQEARIEASRYIGQMQRAMADLARSAELTFLAFLCDVSAREANSTLVKLTGADGAEPPPADG